MARHGSTDTRCPRCFMKVALCMCEHLVPIATRTRVVVLMHKIEADKSTNTGRIAAACLQNSDVVTYGNLDGPVPKRPWSDDTQPLLLYPSNNAARIEDFVAGPPKTLIVLDGTWRQAARLRKHMLVHKEMRAVALPQGAPSIYTLRTGPTASSLSTAEAIARALGVLEGPHVQAHVERALRVMIDRVLWLRGAKDGADVEGGVPEGLERQRVGEKGAQARDVLDRDSDDDDVDDDEKALTAS
jgi:DTW domain-containing protein YfiP